MLEFMNDKNTIEENTSICREKVEQKELKLPKIERLTSRGHPKDSRNNTKLPSLKLQNMSQKSQDTSDRKMIEEDDLVSQVERRLKLIIQQQNIIQIQDSDEEQDNFQRKISENKQLIKKVKRRNQQIRKQNDLFNNNMRFNQNLMKKFSHKIKNEHFQKRFRQLKQIPLQNKLIHKRKQLASLNKNNLKESNKNQIDYQKEYISNKEIPIKDGMKENFIREIKSKDQLTNLNKIIPNVSYKAAYGIEQKKILGQCSQKSLSNGQKNELLFDVIHNYLQNPKKMQVQNGNSGGLRRDKGQLQQKLKSYELKLQNLNNPAVAHIKSQNNDEQFQKDKENSNRKQRSSDWQKIRINERIMFDQQNIHFQKQIQRINKYAEKNQKSLEKYVQNQKMLYEVQMVSRPKLRQKSCSVEKQQI